MVNICYDDVTFNSNSNIISNIPNDRLQDLSVNGVFSTTDISLSFIYTPVVTGITKYSDTGYTNIDTSSNSSIQLENGEDIFIKIDVSSSIVPYKYTLETGDLNTYGLTIDQKGPGVKEIEKWFYTRSWEREEEVGRWAVAIADWRLLRRTPPAPVALNQDDNSTSHVVHIF